MRAILTFHAIETGGSLLGISGEGLRSLLASIQRSGHEIVPLRSLLDGRCAQLDVVALTFDDGARSVAEQAAPILREFGAPASLFLTTGFMGGKNTWPSQPAAAPVFSMLDWDAIGSLQASGWTIEAHTISHPDLRTLDDAALEEELALPAEAIAQKTGVFPRILAYPYGYYNERIISKAKQYYEHAVTTQFRQLSLRDDPYLIPRIDTFYLRSSLIHRHFGNGGGFTSFLSAISWLRKLRRHPGEGA